MLKKLDYKTNSKPGYKKNISFGRLWDHYLLGRNLKRVLSKQTEKPDVAFVGFPPIEFAYEAAAWLKKNKLPFMLDVKDQWPDIFIIGCQKYLNLLLNWSSRIIFQNLKL